MLKMGGETDVATATSMQCTVSQAIAFLFLNTPMRQHAGRLWQLMVPFFTASWLSGSHNKDDWGFCRWSVSFGAGGHIMQNRNKKKANKSKFNSLSVMSLSM